jgi:uncharacterized protein
MPKIVFDASSLVGALLKEGSIPERALLMARAQGTLCLSPAVDAEVREVFGRLKFRRYLANDRANAILYLLTVTAEWVSPTVSITDCRDRKDNKYLELALAASVDFIISSDEDLLVLDPWRGIRIVSPIFYVREFGG